MNFVFVFSISSQDETITQIHQELCDLQSHYQAQLATRDQQLAQRDHELQRIKMASHERPTERLDGTTGEGPGVAQQLDFGAGGCGFGGEERLKELAAQVEDLTYQLSTTEEELQAALERAGHAEVYTVYRGSLQCIINCSVTVLCSMSRYVHLPQYYCSHWAIGTIN